MEQLLPNPIQVAGLSVWFIVVYVLLKKLLFVPYLEVLDRRFADTGGAAAEFSQIRQDVDAADAALKAKLAEARSLAQAKQEKILSAATEEANTIVSAAQKQAQAELAKAAGAIDAAKAGVLGELQTAVVPLADSAAQKLTGARA